MKSVVLLLFVAKCMVATARVPNNRLTDGGKVIAEYFENNLLELEDLEAERENVKAFLANLREQGKKLDLDAVDQLLDDLVSLNNALKSDDINCRGTLVPLVQIKDALGFTFGWWNDDWSGTLVKVVHELAKKLAARCKPELSKSMSHLLSSLDEHRMQLLNSRMDQLESEMLRLVEDKPAGESELSRFRYLSKLMLFEEASPGLYIARAIANLINTSKGRPTTVEYVDFHCVSERKYKKFVDEFFLKPCKYFVDNTQEVLDPYSEFVRTAMNPSKDVEPDEVALRRYSFCRSFAEHRSSIYDPVKELAQSKKSRTKVHWSAV